MSNKNTDLSEIILARITSMHQAKDQVAGKYENTWIELSLQSNLRAAGIEFYTQAPLIGLPDIFIAPNIAIFADGCYYHACRKCGHGAQFPGKKKKDMFNTRKLQEAGFVVFRFWEHDIKANPQRCINKVIAHVNSQ